MLFSEANAPRLIDVLAGRDVDGILCKTLQSRTLNVNDRALTRNFKQTIVARMKRDPGFAKGLFDEAATVFLNGEPDTAKLILRDLVNASVGFEALAGATGKAVKSLHRMLSMNGNPSMDNLAAIFDVREL